MTFFVFFGASTPAGLIAANFGCFLRTVFEELAVQVIPAIIMPDKVRALMELAELLVEHVAGYKLNGSPVIIRLPLFNITDAKAQPVMLRAGYFKVVTIIWFSF